MAKFGLPGGRRNSQPNQTAGIASGNPLTQKLKGAWVNSSALNVNAVKGSGVGDLTAVGGATPFYSAKGVGYDLNGTSQYLTNTSNNAVTSLPVTFFIYAWIDNGGANQRLFDISTGTTADDVIGIQIVNTGNIAAQHYDGATNATAEFSSSGFTGKWTSIAAVFESLTSRKLYLNGVLVASNASTVIAPVGVNRVTIGFAPWASGEYFDGKVIAPQLFGRALNASEILSLHNNPWQTLKPRKRELYVSIAAIGDQTLTPSLYTDGDTFYAPTVTPGSVALSPGLYVDADTLYTATVSPGAVSLTPSLVVDDDTFYAPTVAPGSVALTPALYVDSDNFYSATVSLANSPQTLTPALYADADTFYAATVTGTVNLAPSVYTDADTFYTATVAASYNLQPAAYVDADAFYAASISQLGDVVLQPQLFIDLDTFYGATVYGVVFLSASRKLSSNTQSTRRRNTQTARRP